MVGTTSGVSGEVQYDLDISCYNDHDGEMMVPIGEQSDEGNDILECPECGNRRAANVRVVSLR